jgi:hypothetical protein
MEQPVKRIVIVGGGTAGWLSACYIAAKCSFATVSMIESPDIPTVGVGEGTWPTMRATLAEIGLDEVDFLRSCDGAFKQGSRFDGWVTGSAGDSYYHPFSPPPDGQPLELVAAWRELSPNRPFADAMTAQPAVCDEKLAPKQASMPPYAGALNYAYHLDAGKLAERLSRHANTIGVTRVRDEVVSVETSDDGGIEALLTRSGQRIEGDLFIDCSGHSALLIGGHCGSEWIDCSETLANDRALAVQVPTHADAPIQSVTIGTAHSAGWLWDIGLPNRRGIGCVYSSRFMDNSGAEDVLRSYIASTAGTAEAKAANPRVLKFRSGYRADYWRGNCVAIGLSAGFVEPLEASAIVMSELSLRALVENFPADRATMPLHARRFNELFRNRWERIVEFLKLHYVLSERTEPYWLAQRAPESIPERLAGLLDIWRSQPPSGYDLPLAEEIFPAASYQYVYYGMGGAIPSRLPQVAPSTRRGLEQIGQRTRTLLSGLPTNRAYLNSVAAAPACDKVAS